MVMNLSPSLDESFAQFEEFLPTRVRLLVMGH